MAGLSGTSEPLILLRLRRLVDRPASPVRRPCGMHQAPREACGGCCALRSITPSQRGRAATNRRCAPIAGGDSANPRSGPGVSLCCPGRNVSCRCRSWSWRTGTRVISVYMICIFRRTSIVDLPPPVAGAQARSTTSAEDVVRTGSRARGLCVLAAGWCVRRYRSSRTT